MRLLFRFSSIAALALAAAACGGSSKSSAPKKVAPGKPIQEIAIEESEFKLDPDEVELDRAGIYRFHAINVGKKVHALRIKGPGGVSAVTARLRPGQSTTVDVAVRKKGTYTYFDPVADHKRKGMVGRALLG
jgi:Cupredoxin-like domain